MSDLRTDVTCYVIDAETSYNLLLGRLWIHNNLIVPSTLHQCMKYIGESGEVKTVVAEKQPFKGVENTDSIHYLDGEPFEVPLIEEPDSSNEADTESEHEQGLVFNDIEPVIIGLKNLDVNDHVYKDRGVIFNNNDDLSYLLRDKLNPNMPECYVDDLVVKSRDKGNHLHDLKIMFTLMRAHQLKMNPTKSFIGMASGKFLGFVVTANRIHLDPNKVKAIQELPPPRNLKELRGLQGRLAYIRMFISNLSGKCQSFSKLMKKGVFFMWDEACQKAFEEIKQYLSNPPILVAPRLGKPFLIYIRATDHALAGLLAQDDENDHEQAVYYLSRTLSGAEPCYPLIEKECLALVFIVQKMRHYLVGQTIHVISQTNPIRVFMTQPSVLNWRLARWTLLLSQYDIHFKPQKAMKGQAICDLMANHPLKGKVKLYKDMPDETYEANVVSKEQVCQLYFDGAARTSPTGRVIAEVGVIFISPQNHVLPRAVSLTEPCSNNVAEYNALLVGLEIAKQIGLKHLEAYGDSQLIVNQMKGEYKVRNEDLIPYHTAATTLADSFEGFYIGYVLRLKNTYADALASLAATLALPERATQQIMVASRQLFKSKYTLQINAIEGEPAMLEPKDWRFLIIDYTLYRKSYDRLLLHCLSNREAKEALKEAHDGICGAHQPGPKLWDQLRRLGYYWPNTGMDIVGLVTPPSSKGHRFILAITDYFSKWAEAILLSEVKTSNVIKFLKHHIVYRYDVPRHIIHDNGPQFVSQAFTRFCDKFRIKNLASTAYNPVANGKVEAFNKTIVRILTKVVSTNKRDWNEKLGQSL
ncbi:uncharacterized protein LOC109823389 [Asparagus officinalis]|uniref:uncharacterized protein LOC109823389 n=1 Tax=Asparagus officinalis TaxID=4686 RepID=UPI00098DE210|nr:uncharacterized protein LOC109823389 [Asparagus officinalis]